MKLNLETSKTNVCKEETLLCIFKDVPNFFGGEEETSITGESHTDILLGKQVPPNFLSRASNDSNKDFKVQKTSQEVKSADSSVVKLHIKKPRKKIKEQNTFEELIWGSSSSEDNLLSDDSLPGFRKKRNKMNKKNYRSFGNPSITLSIQYLKTPESNINMDDKYTSSDELCSECLWLVRTAKDSKVSSSSENDDELIKKWKKFGENQTVKQLKNNSVNQLFDITGCNEKDVLKLLNEVHMRLVECSIILTTHKLNKKLKKKANDENLNKEARDTLSDEKLLDEIQEEENTKAGNGTSKLCLVLGKLVSKYLKT